MGKQNMIHIHSVEYLTFVKEWIIDTCYTMDKSW